VGGTEQLGRLNDHLEHVFVAQHSGGGARILIDDKDVHLISIYAAHDQTFTALIITNNMVHITFGSLKKLIKNSFVESHQRIDRFFLENIVPALIKNNSLPSGLKLIGHGNEAFVFSHENSVIRIEPTYEDQSEEIERKYDRQASAPSGGRNVEIFLVKELHLYAMEAEEIGLNVDEDESFITIAVATIMERLDEITDVERQEIDDVITNKKSIDQIVDNKLTNFLSWYVDNSNDPDGNNVMKRGDDYVAIDSQ
jgi:hypothetical protein